MSKGRTTSPACALRRPRRVRDVAIAVALVGCSGAASSSMAMRDGGQEGATNDAGACVSISGADFDQSCQSDNDCIAISVTSGDGVCPNGPLCMCPFEAINARDRARYDALNQAAQAIIVDAINRGVPSLCGCPASGAPRCVGHRCAMCGSFADPACPDDD